MFLPPSRHNAGHATQFCSNPSYPSAHRSASAMKPCDSRSMTLSAVEASSDMDSDKANAMICARVGETRHRNSGVPEAALTG